MRTHRRSIVAICFALALGVAACASEDADGADDAGTAPASDTAPTSDTLAPPVTTTTVASTTTAAPTTTVAITTTTNPAPTTTTTLPPTTTTLPPAAFLPLRNDGIGDAAFGAEPDEVVAYVSTVIGGPGEDSDWVAAISLSCPGTEVRFVRWGDLRVWFGDESLVSSGRRHFFGWSFGPAADVLPSPAGLATQEGVSVGSSVVDIGRAYPTASLFEGDDVTTASAQISAGLLAFITDTRDSGVITAMRGGQACGE